MEVIWVDKYRPKKISDILGHEHITKRISSFVEKKNLPHLLLAGVPGTGKTTTALAIANELYGVAGLQGNFLELNASDDRGINIIRTKIKEFARLKALTNIPFKIIALDEADSLTTDAQQALRRTMEMYSYTCRFILSCNQMSKIIDPIQSRCVIFRFHQLHEDHIQSIMHTIIEKEKLSIDEDAQKELVQYAQGDARRLENMLQTLASFSTTITLQDVKELTGALDSSEVHKMLAYALQGNYKKSVDSYLTLKAQGITGLEILKTLYRLVVDLDLDQRVTIRLVEKMATIEFRMSEGSDEDIQMESLLAVICALKAS